MAYFLVHSLAICLYFSLLVLYYWATSGAKGSSGFGSSIRDIIDNKTLEIVKAGLH